MEMYTFMSTVFPTIKNTDVYRKKRTSHLLCNDPPTVGRLEPSALTEVLL